MPNGRNTHRSVCAVNPAKRKSRSTVTVLSTSRTWSKACRRCFGWRLLFVIFGANSGLWCKTTMRNWILTPLPPIGRRQTAVESPPPSHPHAWQHLTLWQCSVQPRAFQPKLISFASAPFAKNKQPHTVVHDCYVKFVYLFIYFLLNTIAKTTQIIIPMA